MRNDEIRMRRVFSLLSFSLLFFIVAAVDGYSQNPTYGMRISPTTPPVNETYITRGPVDVYPPAIQGICTVNIPDRTPPQFTAVATPSITAGFAIGIKLPSGQRKACDVDVTVMRRNYQTPDVWDPADPAPGVGNELTLTLFFIYSNREHEQQEVYCNGAIVDIDPVAFNEVCGIL